MASFAAARSALRSAGRSSSASRFTAKASPSSSSSFGIPKQTRNLLSRPTSFRSAMETSRCLGSMLPYHTATASALLNSMLSVSNWTFAWTPESD